VLLKERLPGINWDEMYENLRRTGKQFGIVFGDVKMLSNSRMALEASEYARETGTYEQLHEKMFHAYFTQTRDIGNLEVILSLAKSLGLETKDLQLALQEGRYSARLEEAQQEAGQLNITGVPTFIIEGKYRLVGAQSIEVFKEALRSVR
jgi:predicted DsbA family dithiol-disulfide isomerase